MKFASKTQMPSRRNRRQCLICLGTVAAANNNSKQCIQCRHVTHISCYRNWQVSRSDLDFNTVGSAACPLCNIPKPYEDRYCPGCGIAFVRIGGCSHMQCGICRYQFDFYEAPRQQPTYTVYSAWEVWWIRYYYGGKAVARLRPILYVLVGILVGLLSNLLLLRVGTATDAWDRGAFSLVFGGLAATQLMIHMENIHIMDGERITNEKACLCYAVLLSICSGSLVLKIVANVMSYLLHETK